MALPVPIAHVGAPLAAPAPSTVLAPGRFHAVVRIPDAHDRLFVVGRWAMQELHVTLVRGGARTVLDGGVLPGARFGVELPADAAAAERVEIDGSAVNGGGGPLLVAGTDLYARATTAWPTIALFGMLGGVGLIAAGMALALRSAAAAWFAALLLSEAIAELPFLGAVRPPAVLNQPLHALIVTAIVVTSLGFARSYLGRAFVSGWWFAAAVLTSLLTAAYVVGDDVWQDRFPFELSGVGLTLFFNSSVVVLAVLAVRAIRGGRRDATWYLASLVLSALGFVLQEFDIGVRGEALVNALGIIAQACGLAFALRRREDERLTLQRAVRIDALTGLVNRGTFDATLVAEWSRGERVGTPLAAIMIDVDDFKRYNDRFGHPSGDEVLRRVGGALAGTLQRREDCVARYGGEEFVALVPGADVDRARAIAETLRAAIEGLAIPSAAGQGCVTASAGVAVMVPSLAASPEQLVALADAALYEAKRRGRNRVEADTTFVAAPLREPAGARP